LDFAGLLPRLDAPRSFAPCVLDERFLTAGPRDDFAAPRVPLAVADRPRDVDEDLLIDLLLDAVLAVLRAEVFPVDFLRAPALRFADRAAIISSESVVEVRTEHSKNWTRW
jgi:hypothetical protein